MILLLVSILSGMAYFAVTPWHAFPGMTVLKTLPVASLGIYALRRRHVDLGAALLLSAAGDALLNFGREWFLAGLSAFLASHLVYVFTFVRRWRQPRFGAPAAAVILYSLALGAWLVPATGKLAVPVCCYIAAITAMVVSAITARFPSRWVAIGAVLFLISDSILSIRKFRMPIPYAAYLIWATYYGGQLAIALGVIESPRGARRGA
jgi:uncharacterized membrane protein YhhN